MSIVKVAKMAGVSRMTVSRVISGVDSVRPETRKRVLDAMKELSYVPSRAARAMRSKDKIVSSNSLCVALVFGHEAGIACNFFSDIAQAVENEAAENGLCVVQSTFQGPLGDSWIKLQSLLSVYGLAGVIFAGEFSEDDLDTIKKHVENVVFVDGPPPAGADAGAVESDNESGCMLAFERFGELGCRRLLVVTGPSEGHYFSQAFKKAAVHCAGEFEQIKIVDTSLTPDAGYEVVRECFDGDACFDGIFCSDEVMVGAYRAMNELGISVPEDVKAIGFDDLKQSAFMVPSLTSIKIDRAKLGVLAVQQLVGMIRGDVSSLNVKQVVRAELVVRESA